MRPTTFRLLALFALALPTAGRAADPAPPAAGGTSATTALLNQPSRLTESVNGETVGKLLTRLSELHGVTFRLDAPLFRAILGGEDPYEKSVTIPVVANLSVRDVLDEVIGALGGAGDSEHGTTLGVRVRGRQVIVTRGFYPPTVPRSDREDGDTDIAVPMPDILNSYYGPKVAVAADDKPLAAVIDELRESTGSNIVIDPQVREKLAAKVTLTLNDARLMTALKVGGRLAGVAVAPVDNVFYVTDEATAERLTAKWEREVFGVRRPLPPSPAPGGGGAAVALPKAAK